MDAVVQRLAAWMAKNHGQVALLRPPATGESIAAAERELGVTLPAGLRALYGWTAGGDDGPTLMNNRTLSSLGGVVSTRKVMAELVDLGSFDEPDWWHKPWVPFLSNGAGSNLCWDPVGSFEECGGRAGQVLEFWKADSDRNIMAPSFDEWLVAFVESLEAGIWKYDDESWAVEDTGNFTTFLRGRFPGYPIGIE